MKVIAYSYVNGKQYIFETLEEASQFTRVSEKRILACIRTGHRWKMWEFDEGL